MAESKGDGFAIPWPAVITLLAVIGGVLLYRPALESSRPSGGAVVTSPEMGGFADVEARLWQDPLAAASAARKDPRRPTALEGELGPLKINLRIIDGPAAAQATRLVPFKAAAGTGVERDQPATSPSPQPDCSKLPPTTRPAPLPPTDIHNLEALRYQISRELLAGQQRVVSEPGECREQVLVLPVMISGGPYPEDTESRLRTRYAVLSALAIGGYTPRDGERISYVDIPWGASALGGEPGDPPGGSDDKQLLIPYEWCDKRPVQSSFDRTDTKDLRAVLVLWLKESAFQDKPLHRLAYLVNQLQAAGREVEGIGELPVRLVGPRTSTVLRAMVHDAPALSRLFERDFHIYSPTATADAATLLYPGETLGPDDESTPYLILSQVGVKLHRTIGTDYQLNEGLAAELRLRGVYPESDRIALISEWDTLYARANVFAFAAAAVGVQTYDLLRREDPVRWPRNISRHSYLRGIDGRLPSDEASRPRNDGDDRSGRILPAAPSEAPEGRDQSDYLRRLVVQLEREDATARRESRQGKGIRAIGVLGSDVYDKLLILKALRGRFPDVLFFTTDLDARLLHPAEWPATHNLIIASHFGQTCRFVFRRIPPFREGYQTSIYCATLQAMGIPEVLKLNTERPPIRLYEVARGGTAVHLDIHKTFRVVMPTTQSGSDAEAETAETRPGRARNAKTDAPKLVVDVTYSNLDENQFHADEPVQWWSGFRTTWMLSAAALLLLAAMWPHWVVRRRKRPNFLRDTPLFSIASVTAIAIVLVIIHRLLPRYNGEPLYLMRGVSIWPTEAIRAFAALLCAHFLYRAWADIRASDDELTESFMLGPRPRKLGWRTWWRRGPDVLFDPPPQGDDERMSAKELWDEYLYRGTRANRAYRALPAAGMFFLAGVLLMYTYGFPHVPYRGSLSLCADRLIKYISLGLFVALTFLVIDATRLCDRFIRQLCKRTRWPEAKVREVSQERNVDREYLDEYLDIQLIARQTTAVGRLIYYPFAVLTLIIVSRISYFDNWNWPVVLVVLLATSVALLVICGRILRNSAEEARSQNLKSLRAVRQRAGAGARGLDAVIADIEQEKRGAFCPYLRNPILRAFLLPSGGVGIYALLELFAK